LRILFGFSGEASKWNVSLNFSGMLLIFWTGFLIVPTRFLILPGVSLISRLGGCGGGIVFQARKGTNGKTGLG
jgi:hypothetical protein